MSNSCEIGLGSGMIAALGVQPRWLDYILPDLPDLPDPSPLPFPMLSDAQRKYLRRLGHELNPVVLIGNSGLGPNLVAEMDGALAHHELVKVRARVGDREARDADAGRTGSLDALGNRAAHRSRGTVLPGQPREDEDPPAGRVTPSGSLRPRLRHAIELPDRADRRRECALLVADGHDFVRAGAARHGDLDLVPVRLADQRPRNRRRDRDQVAGGCRLPARRRSGRRLPRRLPVSRCTVAPKTTLSVLGRCRDVDDVRVRQLVLELVDAPLAEALLLARRVVLRVLAQVAMGARLGDGLDDARPLDLLEPLELLPQALRTLRSHRLTRHIQTSL